MTHDPRHLGTLEQIMNGSDPFTLIPTPLGEMEKWRAEALLIGSTSRIQDVYRTIRDDATALEARANADKAQHALLRRFFTTVGKFLDATDHMVSRVEAADEERRADEEQQREFEEEPLILPPDLDRLQDLPPSKIEDETHQPSGELHVIAAKSEQEQEQEQEQERASELPEPPQEPETTSDAGKVPLSYGNVPMSYVKGAPKDQAGDLPKELEQGLPEPPPEPKGGVYPQPISISLNKA